MSSIVKFNVGGQIFITRRENVTKYSGFLSTLLSTDIPKEIIDGAIFIDRDPKIFAHILEFLRSDVFPEKSLAFLKRFAIEADYYQIESLIERIDIEIIRFNIYLKYRIEFRFHTERCKNVKIYWQQDRLKCMKFIKPCFESPQDWFMNVYDINSDVQYLFSSAFRNEMQNKKHNNSKLMLWTSLSQNTEKFAEFNKIYAQYKKEYERIYKN
jgi:BTB/POZ domain